MYKDTFPCYILNSTYIQSKVRRFTVNKQCPLYCPDNTIPIAYCESATYNMYLINTIYKYIM